MAKGIMKIMAIFPERGDDVWNSEKILNENEVLHT
jgi:hypothetical protein